MKTIIYFFNSSYDIVASFFATRSESVMAKDLVLADTRGAGLQVEELISCSDLEPIVIDGFRSKRSCPSRSTRRVMKQSFDRQ